METGKAQETLQYMYNLECYDNGDKEEEEEEEEEEERVRSPDGGCLIGREGVLQSAPIPNLNDQLLFPKVSADQTICVLGEKRGGERDDGEISWSLSSH